MAEGWNMKILEVPQWTTNDDEDDGAVFTCMFADYLSDDLTLDFSSGMYLPHISQFIMF